MRGQTGTDRGLCLVVLLKDNLNDTSVPRKGKTNKDAASTSRPDRRSLRDLFINDLLNYYPLSLFSLVVNDS